MSSLAKDRNGETIQALALTNGDGAHQIAVGASSARNTTALKDTTTTVFVFADTDCYIEFGDNTVTADATRHLLPQNTYLALNTRGRQYVAVIQKDAAGTLHISETE